MQRADRREEGARPCDADRPPRQVRLPAVARRAAARTARRCTDDAIFRIYSMTKPIVSVAAMMLVEEGRLSIIDPVSAYIPAFADVKVGVPNGDTLDLQPLRRPDDGAGPHAPHFGPDLRLHRRVARSEADQGGRRPEPRRVRRPRTSRRSPRCRSCISRGRPGNTASRPTCSGASSRSSRARRLSDVLRARLFGPLGMTDTGFFTPHAKLARRADPFSFDFMIAAGVDSVNADRAAEIRIRAAAGLVSTLADYARFAAMLSSGGTFDGVRILEPAHARLHGERPSRRERQTGTTPCCGPGHGFGLGFAVRTDPARRRARAASASTSGAA